MVGFGGRLRHWSFRPLLHSAHCFCMGNRSIVVLHAALKNKKFIIFLRPTLHCKWREKLEGLIKLKGPVRYPWKSKKEDYQSAVILHLCTVHFASPESFRVIYWENYERSGARKWRTWKFRKVRVILVGKPQWRRPPGRQRRTWEDNIKIYFKTLINMI
jgi:hypothetical protein